MMQPRLWCPMGGVGKGYPPSGLSFTLLLCLAFLIAVSLGAGIRAPLVLSIARFPAADFGLPRSSSSVNVMVLASSAGIHACGAHADSR